MGRVVVREIVAIRCELKSCRNQVQQVPRLPEPSSWHDQALQLQQLVEDGWALVLNARLRSFCPAHSDLVGECSCRRHPERAHLCTAHSRDAAELIWDSTRTPEVVTTYLEGAMA